MKTNIYKIIIGLLFLIVFNLLFFILGGTSHSTSEWISYGFIHGAYVLLLATPLFNGKNKAGETVMIASLYLRALIYFVIELIVGLVFIEFNTENYFWPTMVQGLILFVFLLFQFMGVVANKASSMSLSQQKSEKDRIQQLSEKLRSAIFEVNDPKLRKDIERCYESLRNSTIQSRPDATDTELNLENAVYSLCQSVNSGDVELVKDNLKRLQTSIRDRNNNVSRIKD